MANEMWDLFTTDGVPAGTIEKGNNIPQGYYHVTVEVIPTNRKGHMLLTKRAMSKKRGGGKYEFPAGSVLAGETPEDAAKRELREETGLIADDLTYIGSYRDRQMRREVYIADIPSLLSADIRLQKEETTEYTFFTWDQWIDAISSGEYVRGRLSMYTDQLYRTIEQTVGSCRQKEKRHPKKLVQIGEFHPDAGKPVDLLIDRQDDSEEVEPD